MALMAMCLSAVTIWLFAKSLQMRPTQATSPYLIAYISDRNGKYQIYLCDLEGREITSPMPFQSGDVLPVCEPHPRAGSGGPRIAFIRFEAQLGSISATEVGTPGSIYVVTYGENKATKISGKVPRILAVAPAWSPDGKELAFAGVEDLNGDGQFTKDEAGIYLCNVERGGVRRVATIYTIGTRLQWSPVEASLILQAEKTNVPLPVAHLLDLTSGQLITRDDATMTACWSPDGQFIALYSLADRKIHVLSKDGSEQYMINAPGEFLVELHWLPARASTRAEDKGYLLAVVASSPRSYSGQLYLRPASPGSSETWKALTAAEASAAYPAASPDGRYLAYTLMAAHGPTSMSVDLYVLELDKAQPRHLTSDPGFEGFPTWIPVGK